MKVVVEVKNNLTPIAQSAKRQAPDRMYRALEKAGGIVKRGAIVLAPSPRASIGLKVVTNRKGLESRVGFRRAGKGWYGKFFETGTAKHEIKPKKGKPLAWAVGSGKAIFGRKFSTYYQTKGGKFTTDISEADMIFAKSVEHPGMNSKPFLIPAYNVNKKIIKETLADAAIKTLQEAKP